MAKRKLYRICISQIVFSNSPNCLTVMSLAEFSDSLTGFLKHILGHSYDQSHVRWVIETLKGNKTKKSKITKKLGSPQREII